MCVGKNCSGELSEYDSQVEKQQGWCIDDTHANQICIYVCVRVCHCVYVDVYNSNHGSKHRTEKRKTSGMRRYPIT